MSTTLDRVAHDLNIRRAQHIISDQPPLVKLTTTGVSTVSTISQATQTEPTYYAYEPQRPELTQPLVNIENEETDTFQKFLNEAMTAAKSEAPPAIKQAYLKTLLELHALTEEVLTDVAGHNSRQIRIGSAELEQLKLKEAAEIGNHFRGIEKSSTWSQFSHLLQYVIAAANIVLGAILVSTGAPAGAFLIAAGGLGILDNIAKDTNAYKTLIGHFIESRERQEKIANWISTTALIATTALAMTGGIAISFQPGLETARASLSVVDAIKQGEMAIGLVTAGVALGKSYSDNETAKIQTSLQLISGRIFMLKEDLRRNASTAKDTIGMMQIISTQTRQAIQAFN